MFSEYKTPIKVILRAGFVALLIVALQGILPVAGQSYTFQVQPGTPVYLQNFAHVEKGCNWMGVAGQVFDATGQPIDRMVVRVEGILGNQAVDALSLTSLATAYGPGGFEIELAQQTLNSSGALSIALYDLQGQQVSAQIPFNTFSDCAKNLIIVNFIQTGSTVTPTLTPTGSVQGIAVNGKVTLQGRPATPHPSWVISLRVDLIAPGQSQAAAIFTTTTDENGQFGVSNLPTGSYRIGIKAENSLRAMTPVTLLQVGSIQLPAVALKFGDANNDNFISAADFSILAGSFGKCLGTTGYIAKADFNNDKCVTAADFSLLSGNYGLQGD